MSFKKRPKSNKVRVLKKILLAILPGLIVAGLVFAANIYYNLDLGRIITENAQEFKGMVYLGALEFAADSGQISWIDMPVTGSAATNTIQSYTARLAVTDILTVYGEAVGAAGGIKNTRVGIGTSTPDAKLHVYESALDKSGAIINIATTSADYYSLNVQSAGTSRLYVRADGNVGIGTATPAKKLEVLRADSEAQLRISQSSSVYAEFYIAPTVGDLTITTDSSGKNIIIADDNLKVCTGGSCNGPSLSSTGNLVIETDVYAAGYRRISCPTGTIEVPPSPQDGMDGFCVDKYEAKSVGGIATSQAAGTPWINITQCNARAECIRAGKHLITEKEWQAIAHNIEQVGWNWNGGVAGTNQMSDGHSDNDPANDLAADVTGDPDDDPCVGTGQTCDINTWNSQRRTYKLSNGSYIWDFGGNVCEWVDQVNKDEYPVYNSPTAGWVACSTSGDGICGNTLTTNDQWYRGGSLDTRSFFRGGYWNDGANSGAFELVLLYAPTNTNAGVGFRCARQSCRNLKSEKF